jgi:hypothetical protein
MDHSSVQNAFTYTDGTKTWTTSNGSFSWSDNIFTFNPTNDLEQETTYTVNIGTGARDLAENALPSAYSWSFTTVDITSPSVTSKSLEGGDVRITDTLRITFNEPMNKSSVEGAISISPDMDIQSYTWDDNTLIITFTSDLEPGTNYTITIGTNAKDEVGNALEEPYTWSFDTEEKADEGLSPIFFILPIIIIIIVLLILFLMKKKSEPAESLEEDQSEEIDEEEADIEEDEELDDQEITSEDEPDWESEEEIDDEQEMGEDTDEDEELDEQETTSEDEPDWESEEEIDDE